MKKRSFYQLVLLLLLAPFNQVNASTSLSLTLASDYLFNGVSQTDQQNAIQLTANHQFKSGPYVGIFTSNVDFNDGTNLEVDPYIGYGKMLSNLVSLDIGLAFYSYHGGSASDGLNYPELWSKLTVNKTQLALWYTNDYAGTGASHTIFMVNQRIALPPPYQIWLQLDRSMSNDKAKFSWQDNDPSYMHAKIALQWIQPSWQAEVALESTDLEAVDDLLFLFKLTKIFRF